MRLRLGGDRTVLDDDNPSKLRFLHTENAHEAVASFLIAIKGFASLVDVYQSSQGPGGKPWLDENYAVFDGLVCNVRLQWKPRQLINAIIANYLPHEISFEQIALEPLPAGETVNLGALSHFIFGISQMMLVSYFENHKTHLSSHYGPVASWPAIWQFARIVRNAMSHGNKVNITDGKSATWKGLTYSPAENGRSVINSDLFPGDLIVMLRELEDAL